jgi:hypothetical protein
MLSNRILSTLVLLSLPCAQAFPCTGTWNGSVDDIWENFKNWTTSATPPPDCSSPGYPGTNTTDVAVFPGGGSNPTITITTAETLQSLQFTSASPSYMITGEGFTMEAPASQILVSAGSHTIDSGILLAMGTTFEVSVAQGSTLNFTNVGFGTSDTSVTPVNFDGFGTTNISNSTQIMEIEPNGTITVSAGTVNLTNNFPITGTCVSGCTGLIIGPPAVNPTASVNLNGGTFTTTNAAQVSSSVAKSVGLTIIGGGGNFLDAITLNGGNWTNTNTGAISGLGGATNFGTWINTLNLTVTSGNLVSSNTNSVVNEYGCLFQVGDNPITGDGTLTLQGGSISFMNSGTIGDTMMDRGAGSTMEIFGNFNMSGGTLALNNSGTLNLGIGVLFSATGNLAISGGYTSINNSGTPSDYVSGNIGSILLVEGSFQLTGGTLENNDAVSTSTINVTTTGTLAGTGTFFPFVTMMSPTLEVNNSANVVPGSPTQSGTPGTMTINGNYTQSSSGNFIANLKNPTTFSLLQVEAFNATGGTATLDGSITIQASDGYSLAGGESFIVLTADMMTGQFSSVVNNLPPGFTPTVIYNDPSVEILLATSMAATTSPTYPGGFVGTVISFVNQLNQMDRLQRLACPVDKKCKDSACPAGKECQPRVFKGRWLTPPPACPQVQEENRPYDCQPRRWNFYFGPLGTVGGEFHSKKEEIGFDYWSAGGLVGFDYVWPHWGLGMLVAYEYTDGHVHQKWGKFDINQVHTSLYAKFAPPCAPDLAFRGIVGGSYEWYEIDRKVSFPSFGIDETAKGKPKGAEFDSLFGLEYTIRVGKAGALIPLTQLQYIYAEVNHYREHDAGVYDLKYQAHHVKSLRTALGIKGNYTWTWGSVSFTPEANVVWQREFLEKGYNVYLTSAVFDEPTSALAMPGIGRNVFLTGVNLLTTWNDIYSLEARYNFEWNSLFHDHFLYLGFGIRF